MSSWSLGLIQRKGICGVLDKGFVWVVFVLMGIVCVVGVRVWII